MLHWEEKCGNKPHNVAEDFENQMCVEKCNKERQNGRCPLAGYNKATQTCYLSNDDPLDALDTDDKMTGVFFYEPESTGIQYTYAKCMLKLNCKEYIVRNNTNVNVYRYMYVGNTISQGARVCLLGT